MVDQRQYEGAFADLIALGGGLWVQAIHRVVDQFPNGGALQVECERARVELRPRLAELPTTTAIGMNALAPVARGGRMTLLASGGTDRVVRLWDLASGEPVSSSVKIWLCDIAGSDLNSSSGRVSRPLKVAVTSMPALVLVLTA